MTIDSLPRRLLAWTFLAALCLCGRAGSCQGTLAVIPGAGVTAPRADYAQADAGLVDPETTPHLEQAFRLKNVSPQPVTISRLRASCGCETLLLRKGGQSVPTAVLAPGEQAEVKMTVNLAGQRTGLLNKFAWVYGPQGDPPLATLAVAITIREAAAFSPAFLDFGAVATGTTRTLPLTVTVDRSALSASGLPPLVGTRPDLQITLKGGPLPLIRDGKPSVRQDYLVTLASPVLSGRLSGDVRFQIPAGATSPLTRAFVPLGGTVTGALTASPKILFFGSILRDQSVTRQVLLSLAAKDAGDTLSVFSDTPWLLASVPASSAPGTVAGRRLLEVTLKRGAPLGPFEAKITLVSQKGEHLIVPVIADIRAPIAPANAAPPAPPH